MPENNYVSTVTDKGGVYIAEDVITMMVSAAISEVEGVAGLSNAMGSDIADFLGIKSVNRGIKISSRDGKTVVDILLLVRYGTSVAEAARRVQESVCAAVEAMTGMKTEINVHVTGISFEKAEVK